MPPHGMYHAGEEAEGNEDQEGDNESGLTPLDLEALQNMVRSCPVTGVLVLPMRRD
jgi:hypothetical protein